MYIKIKDKFFSLAMSHGLQNLSLHLGIEPVSLAMESSSPNHWAAKEFLLLFLKNNFQEFPGSPVVRTWCFYCWGPQILSLVEKLGSHKPRVLANPTLPSKAIFMEEGKSA